MSLWNKIKIMGALGLLTIASYTINGCKVSAEIDAELKVKELNIEHNVNSKNNQENKKTEEDKTEGSDNVFPTGYKKVTENEFDEVEGNAENAFDRLPGNRKKEKSNSKVTPKNEYGKVEDAADDAFGKLDDLINPKSKVTAKKKDLSTEPIKYVPLEKRMNEIIRTANGYELMFQKGEPKNFDDWVDLIKTGVDYAFYKLVIPIEENSIKIHRYRITGKEVVKEEIGHKISAIDQNKFLKELKNRFVSDTDSYDDYDYTKMEDMVRMLDLNLMHKKLSLNEDNKKDAESLVECVKKNLDLTLPKITKWGKAPEQQKYNFVRTMQGYKLKIDGYKVIISNDNSGDIYLTSSDGNTIARKFTEVQEYLTSKEINKDWLNSVGPHVSLDRSDNNALHLVDVLDNILLNFYTKASKNDIQKGCKILSEIKEGLKSYIKDNVEEAYD